MSQAHTLAIEDVLYLEIGVYYLKDVLYLEFFGQLSFLGGR